MLHGSVNSNCLPTSYVFVSFHSNHRTNIFESSTSKGDDPTQLLTTLEVTDLCGIVSLMYGVLLHSGTPTRRDHTPPQLSSHTTAILTSGFKMLNQLASLDLNLLQVSWD